MTQTMPHAMRRANPVHAGAGAAYAAPGRSLTGPLLIAGHGADTARGALHVAELLARRDRVNAHVLALVPGLPFTASLLTEVDADTCSGPPTAACCSVGPRSRVQLPNDTGRPGRRQGPLATLRAASSAPRPRLHSYADRGGDP